MMPKQQPKRTTTILALALFGAVATLQPTPAFGVVLHVDANAPAGGNGLNWASAYQHLQDALADAGSNSAVTQIWVAAGAYLPDGGRTPPGGPHVTGSLVRTATFQLITGVAIYVGFPPP